MTLPDPLAAIDRFSEARVLVIGDVMLDRFIYGSVERISPEAPIPVLRYERESVMLGGAGNVLRNVLSLGGKSCFVAVVGGDETGHAITRLMSDQPHVTPYLIVDRERQSTEKTRYIAGSQQVLRADRESTAPISAAVLEHMLGVVEREMPEANLIALSDYGKGVLTAPVVERIMAMAAAQGVRVIVDPKARDFSRYRGAWMLTPNLKELCVACGHDLTGENEIAEAARAQMKHAGVANMIVTCGARGMIVVPGEGEPKIIPAQKREVFDVSGAGDTVVATLAVGLASGLALADAATLANIAAGIVVGRMGTAAATRTDLKTAVHMQNVATGSGKIYPLDLAADQVESWRQDGYSVGFTNGCFDLMHVGHLALLSDAKARCDRLIVAINSDASVKRLKGPSRPVHHEMDRAHMLAELQVVDMVVIFGEDTPEETLHRLKPDVLMKGGDYTLDQIVGRDFVESYGGRVLTIPLREGYSTTATIEKIMGKVGG